MKKQLSARPKKSTIVRYRDKVKVGATATAIRLLDSVLPEAAAKWAEQMYLTPPRFPAPSQEKKFMEAAHRSTFKTERGKSVVVWSWGDGPTVFLLHGWAGRGGQFYPFVEPLIRAGYSVVAIDAPGHGQTPGVLSSVVDFCDVLREAVDKFGPAHAVIAHSLGAAATILALRQGLKTNRVVLIAPPNSPERYIDNFARRLGVSEATKLAVTARLERRYQVRLDQLEIASFAKELTTKALIIHDRNDKNVPVQISRNLAQLWPGAELLETVDLGHTRCLKDAKVIHRAVSFIENLAPRTRKGLHLQVV